MTTYAENFYTDSCDKAFEKSVNEKGELDGKIFHKEMSKLKDEKLNELWEKIKKLEAENKDLKKFKELNQKLNIRTLEIKREQDHIILDLKAQLERERKAI